MSDSLHDKLFHYEEQPPKRTWEAVENALNNPSFEQRLHDHQQNPPLDLWNRIEHELEAGGKVVPFYSRLSTPLRYLSAAAVIACIVFGVTLFLDKKPDNSTAKVTPAVQQPARQQEAVKQDTATPEANRNTGNETAAVEDNNTDESNDYVAYEPRHTNRVSLTGSSSSIGNLRNNAESPVCAEDYTTMASVNGHQVRLSKKVAPVYNCAVNTCDENWSSCKASIDMLQSKLACSLGAVSTDFGGLLDILQDLEEKK